MLPFSENRRSQYFALRVSAMFFSDTKWRYNNLYYYSERWYHEYSKCTHKELLDFAWSRGVRVRSTGKSKTTPTKVDFIRALRQADADWTFRFLDLPGELRNMIYRGLLVIGAPSPPSLFPQIYPQTLSTCKKINEEGSSILYGDNTTMVDV